MLTGSVAIYFLPPFVPSPLPVLQEIRHPDYTKAEPHYDKQAISEYSTIRTEKHGGGTKLAAKRTREPQACQHTGERKRQESSLSSRQLHHKAS